MNDPNRQDQEAQAAASSNAGELPDSTVDYVAGYDASTPDGNPLETLPLSFDPRAPRELQPSKELRYRTIRPHAKGGLGEVFVALDCELNREVALKEIQAKRADETESRSRFLLEAEITGGLEHPGIVPVYGLGEYQDGRPYYAMRFIEGDSLLTAIQRFHKSKGDDSAAESEKNGQRSVEFRKLLGRFIDVCNAIGYAHSRNVLHRDLKPANIMLGKFGETLVVDWGLAKLMTQEPSTAEPPEQQEATTGSGTTPTLIGQAVGTPAYMSPEQADGRHDLMTPRSDVYCLGSTFYSLLTGKVPFQDTRIDQVLDKVRRGDFAAPRGIRPEIPPALEAICLKAMALDPEDRYANPQELAEDVQRYLADEPVSAHVESFPARARRWMRKHPKTITALAASLLVGLGSTLAFAGVVSDKNFQLEQANGKIKTRNGQLRAANEAERLATQEAVTRRQEAEKRLEQVQRGLLILASVFDDIDPDSAEEGGKTLRVQLGERLDFASEQLADDSVGDPIDVATMQYNLANCQMGLGYFQKAASLLEKASATYHELKGDKDTGALFIQVRLGTCYQELGRIDQALPLLQRAFEEIEAIHGEGHDRTIAAMRKLGACYLEAGNAEQAIPLLEKSLSLEDSSSMSESSLNLLNDLAMAYHSSSNYQKALDLQLKTLRAMSTNLGQEHPATLNLLNNLSLTYSAMGDNEEALGPLEVSLRLRRKVLGDNHLYTIRTMGNLGSLLTKLEQTEKGVELMEEAIQRLKDAGHTDSLDRTRILSNLAVAYSQLGQPEKALPNLEALVESHRSKPQMTMAGAGAMNSLARLYVKLDRLKDAAPLYEEVLEILRQGFGPAHPNTAAVASNLVIAQVALKDFDSAAATVDETIAAMKKSHGPHDPRTLEASVDFVLAYYRGKEFEHGAPLLAKHVEALNGAYGDDVPKLLGECTNLVRRLFSYEAYEEAEKLARRMLEISAKEAPSHPFAFYNMTLRGAALTKLKRFRESEPLLLSGQKGIAGLKPSESLSRKIMVRESIQHLVDLYVDWNKPEEAAKWREQLPKQASQ